MCDLIELHNCVTQTISYSFIKNYERSVRRMNIQDLFLNQCRKGKAEVTLFLTIGVPMKGKIVHFDQHSLTIELEKQNQQALIYKHAILSIQPKVPLAITSSQKLGMDLKQNEMLSHCVTKKIHVELYLMNGKKFEGAISHFDTYTVILNLVDRKQILIFKHGISTIIPKEKIHLSPAKPKLN